MPSPPPPPTTVALCLHLWRRTELHQRWDCPNILFIRAVITWDQMRIDPETLLLCLAVMCVLLMLNRSHQLFLFVSVQTVSHVSELLSICLVVQHLISSPVCFLCFHLSCPSVTRLRSSLSPVYVWLHSTSCRLSVCSCMPHGASHHCTLKSSFEAALWTVMHFAWWMLAFTVYFTTSTATRKPNVFPHNYGQNAPPPPSFLTMGSMTSSDLIKQVFISVCSLKVLSNITLEYFSSAGQSGYFLLPMPVFSLARF